MSFTLSTSVHYTIINVCVLFIHLLLLQVPRSPAVSEQICTFCTVLLNISLQTFHLILTRLQETLGMNTVLLMHLFSGRKYYGILYPSLVLLCDVPGFRVPDCVASPTVSLSPYKCSVWFLLHFFSDGKWKHMPHFMPLPLFSFWICAFYNKDS